MEIVVREDAESEEGAYFASPDKNALLELAEFLERVFPDAVLEPVQWKKAKKQNVLIVDRELKPPKKDLEALLEIFGRQRG